jgi:hypothetical protein
MPTRVTPALISQVVSSAQPAGLFGTTMLPGWPWMAASSLSLDVSIPAVIMVG